MLFYRRLLLNLIWVEFQDGVGDVVILAELSRFLSRLFIFVKANISWLNTETAAQIRICGPFVAVWYGYFHCHYFFLCRAIPSVRSPFQKQFVLDGEN